MNVSITHEFLNSILDCTIEPSELFNAIALLLSRLINISYFGNFDAFFMDTFSKIHRFLLKITFQI